MNLGELAALLGAELIGDASLEINRVATLSNAQAGDVTFLANRRYSQHLASTQASAVILERDFVDDCPTSALLCEDAYLAYARAAQALNPPPAFAAGVHASAVIGTGAVLEEGCYIGPGAVVEDGAQVGHAVYVGPNCVLKSGVSIGEGTKLSASVTVCEDVVVGMRGIIHPGVVLGADGFGIARSDEGWVKVPQVGRVVIGDDVEIGANTTIDRGALEDTVIGDGVKLDNLIQIGHNVHVGDHTAIAACAAVGGSTRVGKRCLIAGAVSIAGHLEIADDVHLTATSAVPNSIATAGVYSSGMPIQDNRSWRRNVVRMRQLDDMAKRLRHLEQQLTDEGPSEPSRRPPTREEGQTVTDMDIQAVLDYLPHRYPMLLVDRVLECEPNKRLVALKNVTINEPFFGGHFPGRPVMPGVLILEVMAQATGLLALRSLDELPSKESMYYFVGIDEARFRKPVLPGDQLIVTVDLIRASRGIWKVNAKGEVDGQTVTTAVLMGALRDVPA